MVDGWLVGGAFVEAKIRSAHLVDRWAQSNCSDFALLLFGVMENAANIDRLSVLADCTEYLRLRT